MTKKTILTTLLFTTVLSSGTVFAGDRNDLPFASPETQRQVKALPKTDEIDRQSRQIYTDEIFSPDSAAFHRGLYIEEEKQKREDEKHRLAANAKSKQIKAEQQRALQTAEEEAQNAISELKAQIEKNRLAKTQTEGLALQLTSRITNLEIDLTEMEEKVKQEESKVQAEKQKKAAIMTASTEAMNEMKRRLNESRAAIAALKEERDQLESTKVILGKREEGLLAQISLFKSHLDSTMTTVADPNLVPVAASSGKTGGGTIVPSADPNIPVMPSLPASSGENSTTVLSGTTTVAAGESKPVAGGGGVKIKKADLRAAGNKDSK